MFAGALLALGTAVLPMDVMVRAAEPVASAPAIAEPIVKADALIAAQRTTTWTQEGSKYLLLEGDVTFEVGAYGFTAERAVVRIISEPRPGKPVQRLAAYLDSSQTMRGSGPVSAQGRRMLVTVSTTGGIALETDLLEDAGRPMVSELVQAANARLNRYDLAMQQPTLAAPTEPAYSPAVEQLREARRATIRERQRLANRTILPSDDKLAAGPAQPQQPATPAPADQPSKDDQGDTTPADAPVDPSATVATTDADANQPPATPPANPILPVRGSVTYGADRVVFDQGDDEAALMLIGHVRLIYQDLENQQPRSVALKAERAVVFMAKQAGQQAAGGNLDAQQVRGVYLEDNVIITDEQFTVRAPRVYYDLAQNKAILLESVLYTFDVKQQVPLYMRAQVLKQTSASSFEGRNILLTTSEFAEPHVAIGADRVTLDRVERKDGSSRQVFTAKGTTLRVGDVPVFYWPYVAGDAQDIPLRSVGVDYSSDTGVNVTTRWDLFALAGKQRPDGVDASVNFDYRGDHGPATGINLDYDRESMFGSLESYLLFADNGEDRIGSRNDIEHDNETRGYFQLQHRQRIANDWELSLEAAYVSDETFLEEFFRTEAYEAKPYETSLYLKKQQDDWAVDLLVAGNLNDFTPQLSTLQAPGYTVDKLPELGYYRVGTELWDGRLTWFSENRASRMRMQFGDDNLSDRGFSNAAAMEIFGIGANTSFRDAANIAGLPDDTVNRFDTRQEISAPLKMGVFDITPYAAVRFTGYDDDFAPYSGNDDQARLWSSVGTRVHTQFSREYANVESQLFDLHRIRHIVEPSANFFLMTSTFDPDDLPVFDQDVEGISEGGGVRLGLRNTLQTQRGGQGRWRSVDWITLDTDLVLRSDDSDVNQNLARFYDYRPEYSTGGDHFYTQLMWMVSDTLGITGELTYNLEDDTTAQWRIGGTLQHSPRLTSFANYREIDVLGSRLLTYGFTYDLTTKYTVSFAHRLDFSENDSRNIDVWLERKLPRWRLRLVASFDEVDDEQTVGIVLVPQGLSSTTSPGSFFR